MSEARISRILREAVIARSKGICEYCYEQQDFSMDTFAVEHIIPRSKGGSNDLSNLAFACLGCNGCKYTRIEAINPETQESAPLHNPRIEAWSIHFSWSQDYTQIIGLTPTGRATVYALQLNRPGNQNLRRVLHQTGDHPPNL